MDTLILKQITTENLNLEYFPTVNNSGDVELIDLWVDDENYGQLCLEYVNNTCIAHLWIYKQHRTRKKIMELVNGFYEVVHPWIKKKSDTVMAQCDVNDNKTKELLTTLGFDLQGVWVGVMEV